jgi:hypothetical protein
MEKTGMNNKPPNREIERFTYLEGQMMRAGDFQDIQRVADQRRWWHNRAVHNAYGIYQGFEATASGSKPAVIEVSPGLAYDCFGRELFLECVAIIQYLSKPLAAGNVRTLLIRYKTPVSRRESDAVAAVCCFSDGRSSSGDIEFVWVDAPRTSPQEGVPIGMLRSADPAAGRFKRLITPPRRRPFSRPRLGTGSTIPGNTSWQPWDFAGPQYLLTEGPPPPIEIGVQTTIDTSAAGFTDMPQYFAWLEGPIFNSQTLQLVPALLPSIANESLDSFTFRLVLMHQQEFVIEALVHTIASTLRLIQSSSDFADFAQQQGLYVSWLGCQMPADSAVAENQVVCRTKFQTSYERRTRK